MSTAAAHNGERNVKIRMLYFDGLTLSEIADSIGVSRNIVAGVLHRTGAAMRGGSRAPFEDLTGQTFGKWHVISRAPNRYKGGQTFFTCRCDCGCVKDVRSNYLKTGRSQSCGHPDPAPSKT